MKSVRPVPYQLRKEEREQRVNVFFKWLQDLEPNGHKSFYVVTGDKCWISFLQHENVPTRCG